MAGVTIVIGERPFEVAPYKFAELRKAAAHIDQMNTLMKQLDELQKSAAAAREAGEKATDPPLELMVDLLHELVEVLAIGIRKIDPAMDANAIEAEIDLSFFNSVRSAVFAILSASGFTPKGEASAPSPELAEEGAEA